MENEVTLEEQMLKEVQKITREHNHKWQLHCMSHEHIHFICHADLNGRPCAAEHSSMRGDPDGSQARCDIS